MSKLPDWLQTPYADAAQLATRNRLHHATLIDGELGMGQELLAFEMASFLLCQKPSGIERCGQCHGCELVDAGTHADYMLLNPDGNTIKVDQIRDLNSQMAKKPQVGRAKVAVIIGAQRMNINAANALLKMLEEPPENSFFILTSDSSASLLPTIRSRCQLMSVQPNKGQIDSWLLGQDLQHVSLLDWLDKGPLVLVALKDTPQLAFYQSFPEAYQSWLERRKSTNEWLGSVKTEDFPLFIESLQALVFYSLKFSVGEHANTSVASCVQASLKRFGIDGLLRIHQRLQLLKSAASKTNLNPSLQLIAELNAW